MPDADDLANSERASVIAPAGCGKTELIAQALAATPGRRSLVLTHTHAGVKALSDRFRRYGVAPARARVETIAGWCLRYCSSYPGTAQVQTITPMGADWNQMYVGLLRLLDIEAIRWMVEASYDDMYVDEYQDCTLQQHKIICKMAEMLPCRVLGDPLQGIFDFAGATVSWSRDVLPTFPHLRELTHPWRWHNANAQLGEWLLALRHRLIAGDPIDLAHGPLTWGESTPGEMRRHGMLLVRQAGTTIAIRKWAVGSHDFARESGGLFRSMEEMDCKALFEITEAIPDVHGVDRSKRLISFAADCMTNLRAGLGAIAKSIEAGRLPDLERLRVNVPIARALVAVAESDDIGYVLAAMSLLEGLPSCTLYRRELWLEFKKSLVAFGEGEHETLRDAAWAVRTRYRVLGRRLDRWTSARTLLIKGLECDHALLLNADEFEDARKPGSGARNVYVAMTRGCRSLTVLSDRPVVRYSKPVL